MQKKKEIIKYPILGDKQVQSLDFAYTALGWVKAVNSMSLLPSNDIGTNSSIVARD